MKQPTRSRPISFRIPIERWSELAGRADVAGLSPGRLAELIVLDALTGPPPEPARITGTWGAEAAMPPERDQTPAEAAYQADIEARRERQARLDGLRGILPEDRTD